MGLRLYYVDSVAPFLDEILEKLILPHLDFKLRDSFRIVCPDLQTVRDLEAALLEHPGSGNVLIGRSLSTLDQFFREIIELHPAPHPAAGPEALRKALRLSLRQSGNYHSPDVSTQGQYLREFRRLNHLFRIQRFAKNVTQKRPQVFLHWEKILREKWGLWTQEQIHEEACHMLEQGLPKGRHEIREMFFLGFSQLDGYLTEALGAMVRGCPDLTLNLFLPHPETGIDPQGWLAPLYESLEKISESALHYQKPPRPLLESDSYATPLHEAHALAHHFQNAPGTVLGFHGNGMSAGYLRELLEPQSEPGMGHLPPLQHPSLVPNGLLKALLSEKDGEEEIYFRKLHEELLPLFNSSRMALARQGQRLALGHLERAYGILLEKARWEAYQEDLRPRQDWARELQESFGEISLEENSPWFAALPLRSYAQPGLKRARDVFLLELNEGIHPRSRGFSLLPQMASDPLEEHEGLLKLKAIQYLAEGSARFSFFQQDMGGRIQRPSPLWENFVEMLPDQSAETPPLAGTGLHPYFAQHRARETQRLRHPQSRLDRGDLRDLGLQTFLGEVFQVRPLSATYIDDYAKCPWKFFAGRLLGLKDIEEWILEVEPKSKGRFSHALLERAYRLLIKNSFSQGKIPAPAQLEQAMEDSLQICLEEWREDPEIRRLPAPLWREEVRRISGRVQRFLRREWEQWEKAKIPLFPNQLEWRFGKEPLPEVLFPIQGGGAVPLSGAIDRIDYNRSTGEYLLLDYKASRGDELAKQLREGLSFQIFIYLYAVRQALFPEGNPLGGLYGDLKDNKKNQGMAKRDGLKPFGLAKGNNKSLLSDEDFSALEEKCSAELGNILKNIMGGIYPLEPKECQGLLCPYHEICRYDQQPR